jgi:eukaryotic-like serine/threonine-protein kinase
VHDRIAAGGMATVHVGRLLGAAGFSRTVAIKRLHDAYAKDTDFVAMLLDEARLAAMIRHPNVVPTLDVVAEEDELLVVMEYVEGDSVAHLTKLTLNAGQRVPVSFAAAIVAQALHGLHAAHEARDRNGEPLGIVHRDVSPQNILVGIDGVSRVLDFGIAKAASRATATEDGQLKGKTAYMAPEQLQHGAVDRRTDVFAAAVVLWELLCGRRLFFADSPAEIMSRVLTSAIESPQKYAPEVPQTLAAVTLRGLDRDPAGRFATAEDMALAIEEAIAMPRSKDIGSWVATTAKLTLEGRAQLVQLVEASSHKMPAAQQTSDPVLAKAIQEAERRRENAEMATDVGGRSSGALEHHGVPLPLPLPPQPSPPQASPPWRAPGEESTELATVQSTIHPMKQRPQTSRAAIALAVAGGSALVLALGIGLALSSGALTKQRGDTTPPAGVTVAEPVLTAPTASASASAVAVAPPSSSATVAPPPSTATTTKTTRTTGSRPPPSRKCDIDYVIDAQGHKHFKPECVGP